jgi:hypothetical protein
MCGCDYVRDATGSIVTKTHKRWEYWAAQRAKADSKRDRFAWTGVVVWVEWRECYRVNFAGQKAL